MANELSYILKIKDEATKTLSDVSKKLEETSSGASTLSKASNLLATSMKSAVVASASLTAALGGVFALGISSAAKFEQYQIAFTTLLKDQQKAAETIKIIQKDAADTPFELAPLVAANQRLISAGINAEKARKDILNLGNAISATGGSDVELERLSVNLQQIKSLGKATALDIRQFAFAGINIYQMLAESTGKTVEQVRDLDITYEMLSSAFEKASGKGGMFEDAMIKQSKSLNGLMSTLKDVVNLGLKDILVNTGAFELIRSSIERLIPAISSAVQGFVKFINENQDKIPIFAGIITGLLAPAFLAAAGSIATLLIHAAPVMLLFSGLGAAMGVLLPLMVQGWPQIQAAIQPVLAFLSTAFQQIKAQLTEFAVAVLPMVIPAMQTVVSYIQSSLQFVLNLWNMVWPTLAVILTNVWEQIKAVISIAWGIIQVILSVGLAVLSGNWAAGWQGMKKGLEDIWGGIIKFLQATWSQIKTLFGAWIGEARDFGRNIAGAFVDAFSDRLNGIKDGAIRAFEAAKAVLKGNSPPIAGPLKDIDKWGFNIGNAWVEGMRQAMSVNPLSQPMNTYNQNLYVNANVNSSLDAYTLGNILARQWEVAR